MEHYGGGEEDKISRVKADMDDVKNVMVDNIEKVLKLKDNICLWGIWNQFFGTRHC